MDSYRWLLLFHLFSAFAFFSGAVVAGVLQVAALSRQRPSEILTLLRLTRVGVVLVGVGSLGTLGFGIGLVSDTAAFSMGDTWVSTSLALWVASMALGGVGGRTARHARYEAERLAAAGDAPSEELRALVAHRPSLYASYASAALIVAIVVLMVWKPT